MCTTGRGGSGVGGNRVGRRPGRWRGRGRQRVARGACGVTDGYARYIADAGGARKAGRDDGLRGLRGVARRWRDGGKAPRTPPAAGPSAGRFTDTWADTWADTSADTSADPLPVRPRSG
ncbi:hypothetical protein Bpla01_29090 [Burkholderia plantarii]|nr:hypothetical protein Bpla01_29090 [Burkholderia plantarii]